jgi:two-component system chemotaxis response regulator CheY
MNDKKILIVDDSKTTCVMLEEILREDGFVNITHALNGEEALMAYAKEQPDLVLLDIIMPEMNGMDVLKQLDKQAKVLIVSAIGQDSVIKQAQELGALDYIIKPLDKKEVLKKVLASLK